MEPAKDLIIQFNTIITHLKITEMKRDLIFEGTNGRTDRTKKMTNTELKGVIAGLNLMQSHSDFKAGNRKRRRILSLCHQFPPHLDFTYWDTEKECRMVNMERLNTWLVEKGKYNKKLNYHTPLELSKVIVQFENILKGYLNQ
jgi:hypothetical protein